MEWIGVDEGLPRCAEPLVEEGEWVLIWYDTYEEVELACRVWIDEDFWEWRDISGAIYPAISVTHWMPLPGKPHENT
jgi:hypothetical protein